jgi:hypothetical protein
MSTTNARRNGGQTFHEFNECSANSEPKNITPKAQTLITRLDDLINVEEANIPVVAKLLKLVLTQVR